ALATILRRLGTADADARADAGAHSIPDALALVRGADGRFSPAAAGGELLDQLVDVLCPPGERPGLGPRLRLAEELGKDCAEVDAALQTATWRIADTLRHQQDPAAPTTADLMAALQGLQEARAGLARNG